MNAVSPTIGLTVARSRPSIRVLLLRMLERTISFSASLKALATLAASVTSSSAARVPETSTVSETSVSVTCSSTTSMS